MTEEKRRVHEQEDELRQALIAAHVRDGEPHVYMSTACIHAMHGRCRMTCKFCDAPCRCSCHAVRIEKPLAAEEAALLPA